MTPDQTTSPNIVLFMVDQLSAKWLEAAFEGASPTPNLDRLRTRGVTFTRAFTSNPVCCPTRATLATGLTTRSHGVLENGYRLDPALPTFMHQLQHNGWRTGACGKVHLLPHYAGLHPDYHPYGFDVTHITEDPRGGEWLDWVMSEHPQHLDSALATVWAARIPEFATYGPDRIDLRSRIEAIRKDFSWKTDAHPENNPGAYTLPFPTELSQTEWITRHAIDFIHSTPASQPLFLHVSYVQPHGPYAPPAEFMPAVDTARIPAPAAPEWTSDPVAPAYFSDKQPVTRDWHHPRHCYFADIAHLDQQLGRVVSALEDAGRADSSYLVFLSDHGDLLGDHGFYGKEERHYDACIRVPLTIAGPGLATGAVCDHIVQLEDICPTILDWANLRPQPMPTMGPYLKTPADQIPVLPGRSLAPLCRGQAPDTWRTHAYSESYNAIWSCALTDWARTVRTARYRYTLYCAGGGEQLFDLANDPDEQHNLAASRDHAAIRTELRDRLLDSVLLQDYPKTRRDLFALGVH